MRTHDRRDGRGGFTLIELLVVIAIIGILAALLLPVLAKARCHASEGTSISMIRDVETSLKAYEADYGVYPPTKSGSVTGGMWGLVYALGGGPLIGLPQSLGPHGLPYYEFKKANISNGEFYSPLDGPYYYANAANPMGHTMRKLYTFDMWTKDCDIQGTLGAEQIANVTKCKNW
ncbi:MAG: prepilin-type N-terminal cleavage/methylation domain-containing protein [Planctomycetes bacterium]|nr:prepilin-type N-terminal cleavage/methylation domain-containing protein [Planctomycetota bacterium]